MQKFLGLNMVWAPLMPGTPSRPQFLNMPLSYTFQTAVPRCWKGHSFLFPQNTSSSINRHSAHTSMRCRIREQLFHIPGHLRFPSELFWLAGICEPYRQIKYLVEVSIKMLHVLWCGKSSHFTKEALQSFVDWVKGSLLFSSLTWWVKGRCGSLSLSYTHPTSQSPTSLLSYWDGRFRRIYCSKQSVIKIVINTELTHFLNCLLQTKHTQNTLWDITQSKQICKAATVLKENCDICLKEALRNMILQD